MSFMENIEYWHWLVFGMLMLGLEILVFGAIFLWFGIAALIVGTLVFVIPTLMWMPQVVIWSILAVVGAYGWQIYKKKHPSLAKPTTINRRGEQIVGRHFTLNKDIVNGVGELHIDDTRWKIVSYKDLPAGMKVKVIAVEGTSLRVEEFIS